MTAHNLLYLPAPMLSDRLAMRNFFVQMRHVPGKSVVLHAPREGLPEDVRFQTKRISAMLSEEMVTNNPYSGDARQLLSRSPNGSINVRTDLLGQLLRMVNVVLLSPVVHTADGPQVADPGQLLPALAQTLGAQRHVVFVGHALSPLGQATGLLSTEDRDRYLAVYPEEAQQIDLAASILPATLLSAERLSAYFSSPN